ncbi:MAG: chemotaxis protein CheW [Calditrichaeota bacterium]|nr:chemotaxis protein CheW [Calditrichota bacterium]MCB9369644.1 chemotaxis protein CheW [Calditrichota bacterium]
MEQKWVTFSVRTEMFAFELENVQEMIRMPKCRSVPRMGADDVGVTMLRNRVIPVVDLAKTLGYGDGEAVHGETLGALLRDRKQDHINWIDELANSARSKREFKLTLDPHKCKFGVWYDSFQTDDPWLKTLLKRMEVPHAEIHKLGGTVIELVQKDNPEGALKLIEDKRTTVLHSLLDLLDKAIEQVTESTRKILIVLSGRSGPLGVAVDAISTVVAISPNSIQPPDALPGIRSFDGLIGFTILPNSGTRVQLLDPLAIYPQLTSQKTNSMVLT